MTTRVITFMTDFGHKDPYVGVMKGVVLSICPAAKIVDLCHEIEPQNIAQAAMFLGDAFSYFPLNTIHLVVVDPGVGSERKGICISTPKASFVAPDNGVLTFVFQDALKRFPREKIQIQHLDNPKFFLPEVSRTFHGRDVFAPVVAHLAKGTPPQKLGPLLNSISVLSVPLPLRDDQGKLKGEIISIDHFGNCITNITRYDLAQLQPRENIRVDLCNVWTGPVLSTYSDVDEGHVVALIGASDRLELALRNGNLSRHLEILPGRQITAYLAR